MLGRIVRKIFITISALMIGGLLLATLVYNGYRYYVHYTGIHIRNQLFLELKTVELENCTLKRFGDANDGGYLLCQNLIEGVTSAYSYGIGGTDKWGCDVSKEYNIIVHEYDCFDTRRPVCEDGNCIFHEECVGDKHSISENRIFDTIRNHIMKNRDEGKSLVVKMDVEGAEWDTFLATPDDILNTIDQLIVEFHGVDKEKYVEVIKKLRNIFYLINVHFNNSSCDDAFHPFPSKAYEVLFVNKRIGIPNKNKSAPPMLSSIDSPNAPFMKDCQQSHEFQFEFWPNKFEYVRQRMMVFVEQQVNELYSPQKGKNSHD